MRDNVRNKMGRLAAAILLGMAAGGWAQDGASARPCDTPEGHQLDFWLGEWELSWPAEQFGGKPGDQGHGTNTVTRILDDCIVQEAFHFPGGSFKGHSVSVYDARAKLWRQTWVDNQGGYLAFTGKFEDGKMELRTAPYERDGTTYVSRMVFRDITPDGLRWDWQRSKDGGKTWQDLWNIRYQRKAK